MHEAEVAFLNDVVQWQVAAVILAGNAEHETQVAFDHAAPGIRIPSAHGTAEAQLFVGIEQLMTTYVVQVAAIGAAWCFLGHVRSSLTVAATWRLKNAFMRRHSH